jgi:hypothetical protein
MSDDFVKIGTTFDTDGFVAGKAISAFQIAPADLVKACAAAAEPGLRALQANVSKIRPVTGRLGRSPRITTRQYQRGAVACALVGYEKGVAPHAYLIEYGIQAKGKRRGVAGKFPLGMAFVSTKTSMQARLKHQIETLAAKAVFDGIR